MNENPSSENALEVVPPESRAIEKQNYVGFDLQTIMEKAIEKGDVNTIERLMVMRRELRDETAKAEYDRAMKAFQSECPPIVKGKAVYDNSNNRAYSYAPLEDIVQVIKPYLEKHGFSYTFDCDTDSEIQWCIVICEITHVAGHKEKKRVKLPLGAGTRMMSQTQVYAAALSFGNRRALVNAFGLTLTGEDRDGADPGMDDKTESPRNKPDPDVPLRRRLNELTRSIHMMQGSTLDAAAKAKLRQWLVDETIIGDRESVSGLTGDRLAEVVKKVEARFPR